MALIKTIEKGQTGQTNSYWRVVELHLSPLNNVGSIVMGGYKDKASRVAGKVPDDAIQFEVKPESFTQYFTEAALQEGSAYQNAYDFIKALVPTQDAQGRFVIQNPLYQAEDDL